MVGYGMIDNVIGGQILSAVSGGSISIVVGIVIVALISWLVAVFGMSIFHPYKGPPSFPTLFPRQALTLNKDGLGSRNSS